ncbi:type IV toxin-antitoxin system AbiEi family antitoxin domain-containing protein [Iamia majanohamensis]|uniref:Type IV toxin-antitoxin system AbiEi family antitoxin domain-containing protein n=1 Tax=Iamia majanohamensis TaxID=467976 RepID=A0AAF0BSW1_9ACTN|nr:type IV toxin-antitoxin system AbiEi family antitoxin domain-containing protein [Iamia majanohamensis]WCO65917.1 type IV toxin-antitoxin system AbiEi family antitoxin domain-containing protein [Iamia majanohamensis]
MDPWTDLMDRAAARHGIVTYTELVAAGRSPQQIVHWCRTGFLVTVQRGVYRMGGAPDSLLARVSGAVLCFDGDAWASHHTASDVFALGVSRRDARIQVVREVALSAQRTGIQVHRSTLLPAHHLTTHQGIPITSPARTIFDLARTTGPHRLDQAIARATQRRLCTVAEIHRVLFDLGGRGRPGTRRLRSVLERWDAHEPATESELDQVGRALLQRVPGIEWQVPIADEQGHIRTVDGLIRATATVLEFDGAVFHDPPRAAELDVDQDRRLTALGYAVRRFRWHDLTRRDDLTLAEVHHLAAVPLARPA